MTRWIANFLATTERVIPEPSEVFEKAMVYVGVPAVVFTILNAVAATEERIRFAQRVARNVDETLWRAGRTGDLARLTLVEMLHAAAGGLLISMCIEVGRVAGQDGSPGVTEAVTNLDAVLDQPPLLLLGVCGLPVLLSLAALLRSELLGWFAAAALRIAFGVSAMRALLVALAGIAIAIQERSVSDTVLPYVVVEVLFLVYLGSLLLLWPSIRRLFAWEPP